MKSIGFLEELQREVVARHKTETRRLTDPQPYDYLLNPRGDFILPDGSRADLLAHNHLIRPRYKVGEIIYIKEPYIDDIDPDRVFYKYDIADIQVLQGIIPLLTSANFDHILHVIQKDFSIANMTGIKHFLSGIDDTTHRHLAYDNVHLHFGKQRRFDGNATVVLGLPLLGSTAHHMGYSHAGDADGSHGVFERFQPRFFADNLHFGELAPVIAESRHFFDRNRFRNWRIALNSRRGYIRNRFRQHGKTSIGGQKTVLCDV